MKNLFRIIAGVGTLLICCAVRAAGIEGPPRVVDGDTITIGDTRIRLEGIDAPETDQICLDGKGARWTCGIDARDKLSLHIAGQAVRCNSSGLDAYRRTLATCFLGSENMNDWMVQQGWALAYIKYSSAYITSEQKARDGRRGLWQGAFIAPWDWRSRNRKTVILGALSVPIHAQEILLAPTGMDGAPSPQCAIKGNVSRDGERTLSQTR